MRNPFFFSRNSHRNSDGLSLYTFFILGRSNFTSLKYRRWNGLPVLRLAIVAAALGGICAAQRATDEPAPLPPARFQDYPFEKWTSGPERSPIKWEIHLLAAELTAHQRLLQRIQVLVPGSELEKRRGRGELVLLARFEDSDGRQWRSGNRLNLQNVPPGVKSQELTFTLGAFIRPGEYKVLIVLADTGSTENSFSRRALHVAELKNDPLPDSWQGLPSVEVLSPVDVPEAWFLPEVKDRLHLVTTSRGAKPPQIDLLVNVTPSEKSPNAASSQRRNMSAVLPAVKALSATNVRQRPPSAAFIDLTHQRIGYETPSAAAMDWHAVVKALADDNPGLIDAKSLAAQASMRDYFAREVAQRAGAEGPPRWLIVVSGSMFFSQQEISALPDLPPDPNRHIVYLRLSGFFGSLSGGRGPGGRGRGASGSIVPDVSIGPTARIQGPVPGLTLPPAAMAGRGGGRGDATVPDDLEHVLRPLGAQVVSVTTPEIFRKTLAALLSDMSAN